MIIFGTKGVTYSADRGTFFCPSCGCEREYVKKRVRRCFHLYFIPTIPLGLHGEYVECLTCRGQFKVEVLGYSPQKANEEFLDQFQKVLRRALASIVLADGDRDGSKALAMKELCSEFEDRGLTENAIAQQVALAKGDTKTVGEYLREIGPYLNDDSKEFILRSAFVVAAANGELGDQEDLLMQEISVALGMSPTHVRAVLREMTQEQ